MFSTQTYREQHQELLDLLGSLATLLDQEALERNARGAFDLLGSLSARLNEHLESEDAAFYPYLIRQADRTVADVARKFHEEVGWIKALAGLYFTKWSTLETLQMNAVIFIAETGIIARVIIRRIRVENEVLFDLADHLDSQPI